MLMQMSLNVTVTPVDGGVHLRFDCDLPDKHADILEILSKSTLLRQSKIHRLSTTENGKERVDSIEFTTIKGLEGFNNELEVLRDCMPVEK
jgi:hypothetical protein